MSILAAMGVTLAVLVVYMTLIWLVSLARHDASVVDPFWGLGFIVAAVAYLLLTDGYRGRMVLGFFFEVTADTQLALFKRRPENKGHVLASGVWKYSRHPNYFGETLVWWGIWLIAAAAHGYWSVYGPIIITLLLLRVSGVTLLEKNLKESKPGYADYVRRTSSFVPWFPRKAR